MSSTLKISDLSGLCILTFKGGDSPLCVGELAKQRPFAAFAGENPKMWKTTVVSNTKLDGIIRRQQDRTKHPRFHGTIAKQPQQFHQSVVSLVKNVSNDTFNTKLTPDVVEFITGKKFVKGPKGFVCPPLTQEQMVICTLAEFALDKFHTLNGIELKCSFYQGGEVIWKSKF